MANYLDILPATAAHIQFLRENPALTQFYGSREMPPRQGLRRPKLPKDWPRNGLRTVGPEVSHKNVELYHWVVNDGFEPVPGGASLFQTWIHTEHDAIELGDRGESGFALEPSQVPDLLFRVERVTPESATQAFEEWREANRQKPEDAEAIGMELARELSEFAQNLRVVVENGFGLIWNYE